MGFQDLETYLFWGQKVKGQGHEEQKQRVLATSI